ncbi:hypothetical protein [Lentimicrobium sp.]|uniref:Rieske (2Fe-2S) protein n=1 Tax=Lentimicrobium sp. TaxID=2034841 RepID=UPI002BDEFBCE|nr:hypothetical protein [Lentimicrobium sp.]MCO5262187.1 hypothetical protein [Lentimicrobium sp.]HOP13428.1 hypothetical protein [Lentimicrobium sp.]HPJ63368.1 hypothetical protein [Lentimicrobium sp.]HRW70069.1 hypothetical protein [Lentimicrobium sp.]
MKKVLIISAMLTATLLLGSCDKENERDEIPYVYVNFVVYPNTLDFIPVGDYAYFSGGYKGIIIYRQLSDDFKVYERACPHDPLVENARVFVEESGIIAIDTVCGSRFLLTDGSPIEGPATIGLKQYRTRYDGFSLQVMN